MEGGCVVQMMRALPYNLCLRAHGWTRNLPDTNLVTGEKGDDFFSEAANLCCLDITLGRLK